MDYSSGRFDSLLNWLEALAAIREHLSYGDTVLDFGCGTGGSTRWLSRAVGEQNVWGVDVNRPQVEHARTRYPRLQFRTFGWLQNNELIYENAVLLHSLGQVRDPDECLKLIHSRLQPYGRLFLTQPGLGYHCLKARGPGSVPDVNTLWSMRQTRALLEKHGFRVLPGYTQIGERYWWFPQHYLLRAEKA